MNPASPDFHNRSATSPALFNRCVLDWFGEWSEEALFQVGSEFTKNVQDLDNNEWEPPVNMPFGNFEVPEPLLHRDAVISTLVFVHTSVEEANKKLLKKQGRHNYLTPRHYLDFIKHLVNLVREKREDLEDQQKHLNKGLDKLKETEKTVKELQESLTLKERELEQKNKEAEAKLKQMVEDQQFAEEKKKESETLQQKLDEQNKEINVRRQSALERLGKVQPLVEEAQKAVSNIKQQHLVEIRTLARPPESVQKTMQAVLVMLFGATQEWGQVRKTLQDPGFIPNILEFNSRNITPKIRQTMKTDYLSDPKWTFEIVNHASRACGPLVKWIRAQLEYSEILDQVKPLENEIEELAVKAKKLTNDQEELKKTIDSLQKQISQYKEEYAILISDASNIRTESQRVKEKVERSVSLLQKLSGESERWEQQRTQFELRMSTVVGDVVLCAAFLSYTGYFDQFYRAGLTKLWKERLSSCNIAFKEDLSVVEYLSTPDQRLSWTAHNLPADELCQENALMLQTFNRYPLVIDPSGQAAEFLMSKYKDKRITKTSFLDTSFMKNLEAALRFGTPLLVQDVESIDPVLNPVLNKEIYKKGGRVLIKLGDQEVDFSPSFVIFLSTRDPLAHFTPDLCSRVTFVNFTVTPSSLQAQCLFEILKTEAPETFKKREVSIKLQGEFQVKLRNLQKDLLQALSESSGNLLDNDKIINTLENLKSEATDIMQQVENTNNVIKEIEEVSSKYHQISSACSSLYFTMDQLDHVHFLYRFSLNFFFRIFNDILHNNPHLEDITDPNERIQTLMKDLFSVTFERVARSLLHSDQMALALRFAQIRLKESGEVLDPEEFDFLLRGGESMKGKVNPSLDLLTPTQRKYLAELELLPAFQSTQSHILENKEQWTKFLKDNSTEHPLPKCWKSSEKPLIEEFRALLILKSFRPDRLLAGASQFVGRVFSEPQFLQLEGLDLRKIYETQSSCTEPLMLCSTPGFDASSRIDILASALNKKYVPLAMGSDEGFDLAEKTVFSAAKEGSWVLLKNVHLAARWLHKLEKKLYSLVPHPNFRLFMTSEIHPKLPSNLLRLCRVFVVEPPPGVRANLQRTLSLLPSVPSGPKQKQRVYLLLAWLHAVVQERLVYSPLGWTKGFEFNESDLRVGINVIDQWIDGKAQGKDAISPEDIPWEALRSLLGQCVYGGKIDNPFDQRLLDSFLDRLFRPETFQPNFHPSLANPDLALPNESWLDWVEKLSDQKPTWLGLPDNAESLLLSSRGKDTLQNLHKLQTVENDDDDEVEDDANTNQNNNNSENDSSSDKRPVWMMRMKESIQHWLKALPEKLEELEEKSGSAINPMWRFYNREISFGAKHLAMLREDLSLISQVCDGSEKQTNHSRSLMGDISKGVVPTAWKKYSIPAYVNVNAWIIDFGERIKQLQKAQKDYTKMTIWLGGLFNPEAFITATRQLAAQSNKWSLETLVLHTSIDQLDNTSSASQNSFIVSGLTLEGAGYTNQQLTLTQSPATALPLTRFCWTPQDPESASQTGSLVPFPLYINDTRMEILTTMKLNPGSLDPQAWYQRSVAVTAWRNQ